MVSDSDGVVVRVSRTHNGIERCTSRLGRRLSWRLEYVSMNKKVRPSHFRVLALPAFHRRDQNPFTALLYDQIGRFDVEVDDWSFWRAVWKTCEIWHFHHPDTVVFPRRRWQSFAEATAMRFLLGLAKLRGIKVLWTVHDLGSHDGLHPGMHDRAAGRRGRG